MNSLNGCRYTRIIEGEVNVLGYYDDELNVYVGDTEMIEIFEKYEGKKIKITIESE